MEPQTVNAVNLPLNNGLNFPAAILQPPFFDPKAPAARTMEPLAPSSATRSATPSTTEGAAFDSQGRVRNWWTPETSSTSTPPPPLSPRSTTPTNPSPVSTSTASRPSAKTSPTSPASPPPSTPISLTPRQARARAVDGFTGDQQFFIAFAQNWASVTRDAALRHKSSPTRTHPDNTEPSPSAT